MAKGNINSPLNLMTNNMENGLVSKYLFATKIKLWRKVHTCLPNSKITCSKSTIEALEKCVKYVQS